MLSIPSEKSVQLQVDNRSVVQCRGSEVDILREYICTVVKDAMLRA